MTHPLRGRIPLTHGTEVGSLLPSHPSCPSLLSSPLVSPSLRPLSLAHPPSSDVPHPCLDVLAAWSPRVRCGVLRVRRITARLLPTLLLGEGTTTGGRRFTTTLSVPVTDPFSRATQTHSQASDPPSCPTGTRPGRVGRVGWSVSGARSSRRRM